MSSKKLTFLDCTLRDGGYYNNWDFSETVINDYLKAIDAAGVGVVEIGFRTLINKGFKGVCAYSTDDFLNGLDISHNFIVAVMVNASELINALSIESVLSRLFPNDSNKSKIGLVRIACHAHEFVEALPAANWLKSRGYKVGFNLMQIATKTEDEIKNLAKLGSNYQIDVLYFADSLGSMQPKVTAEIISWIKAEWKGDIGIHTHDNMGLALSNSLHAIDCGVTWIDSTVTGMGRGPGNARTEELAIELSELNNKKVNLIKLITLIEKQFMPMKQKYNWGTNIYYYLAGMYGIHPSYIQVMQSDARYNEKDMLAVIDYLKNSEGYKFDLNRLESARQFFHGAPQGSWKPEGILKDRPVLVIGTGPGTEKYKRPIEKYIRSNDLLVIALNTTHIIDELLIDYRVACHPVRLLADCERHITLSQPLITPYSMLPSELQQLLEQKEILDFGISINTERFVFHDDFCEIPAALVLAYVLALASSGRAKKILMVGFDGYQNEEARNRDTNEIFEKYMSTDNAVEIVSLTPTRYNITCKSIFGIIDE